MNPNKYKSVLEQTPTGIAAATGVGATMISSGTVTVSRGGSSSSASQSSGSLPGDTPKEESETGRSSEKENFKYFFST